MPSRVRTVTMMLAVLSVAVMSVHLWRGPNFVLDDWFNLRAADDPASLLGVSRDVAAGRPGILLAYGFTYAVIGNHPLLAVGLLAVIHLATTLVLFRFLRRLLPERVAALAVAIWVISPNHMSLEVWPSTVMIALSLLLTITGADLIARRGTSLQREHAAAAMFGFAAVFYEASMPAIAFLTVAIPWFVERRLRYRLVAVTGVSQLAIAAWIVSHWHSSHSSEGAVSLRAVLAGHFGEGLVGSRPVGAGLLIVVLTSVAVLAYRDLPQLRRPLGQDRSGTTEPLFISIVGVALAVVALGALPFTFYFYTTQGPGDRVLYLSSIASSVILGALFERALQARRETAMAVLAPLLLVVGVQRWDKAADWDWAGDEGVAILSTIHDRFPAPPTGAIVIGPEPVSRGNLAPFVDHSNIRGAMAVLYPGAGVDAYVAHDRASFEQFEEQYRFDLVAIANDTVELTGP